MLMRFLVQELFIYIALWIDQRNLTKFPANILRNQLNSPKYIDKYRYININAF
ncbi:hypothetical protein GCA01S_076_00130 [Parageobacillus caldoxylosilyticus NBRC 107762]|uniref:Uncharacterized protein n=1 Tax=Parageobacillus caldoxylosilyticus NBRC 107762 TaxID=1220594 RepID=A0A023DKM8_9BACL|nr:hypothetical protein PcaKH35_21090 [Parageobacillus caldoxylosilyticus]GAJ41571.1 hypothetical protein GCA01S_076_00130 [Parageobacillus caldoxylosilyticus NBRC 107762]